MPQTALVRITTLESMELPLPVSSDFTKVFGSYS